MKDLIYCTEGIIREHLGGEQTRKDKTRKIGLIKRMQSELAWSDELPQTGGEGPPDDVRLIAVLIERTD